MTCFFIMKFPKKKAIVRKKPMKLKTRLIISFCIIIFVPIILAVFLLFGLYTIQSRSNSEKYLVNGSYESMANSLQILNHYVSVEKKYVLQWMNENPQKITDIRRIQKENAKAQENYTYLIVRDENKIIFNGAQRKQQIDLSLLPNYGDNSSEVNIVLYTKNNKPALLRQIDYTDEQGRNGSVFLVVTAEAVVPQIKALLFDAIFSILVILIMTASILITWTYRGFIPQLRYLVKASDNIKEGNLDTPIVTRGNDEIAELSLALEEMRKRLQANALEKIENEQEQKQLISNIAHDLKTPITAVKGYAEGLLDGVASTPEKQKMYLKTIYNKANEMNSLINELTLYTKIDTNRIPYNFQRLNVKNFFLDCAEEIGMDLENQQVEFSYYNYVADDTEIIADAEQLERVIHNIVGNSVKYRGDEKLVINLQVKDVGDFIQVELQDNGRGISPKDLPYIFDRLYRADASRNSKAGGNGIGLSIVKKIIEDHGGNIWATSKLEEGTVMYFVLRKYQEAVNE